LIVAAGPADALEMGEMAAANATPVPLTSPIVAKNARYPTPARFQAEREPVGRP
jgi:hypothetical protein